MNDNIENIFHSAQTEKNVKLSAGAWNRMDELLENDKSKSKRVFRLRFMGIAASFLVLFGMYFTWQSVTHEDYQLEMLVIDKSELLYSTSEIAQLNQQHQMTNLQKLRPFYNENGQVIATVN